MILSHLVASSIYSAAIVIGGLAVTLLRVYVFGDLDFKFTDSPETYLSLEAIGIFFLSIVQFVLFFLFSSVGRNTGRVVPQRKLSIWTVALGGVNFSLVVFLLEFFLDRVISPESILNPASVIILSVAYPMTLLHVSSILHQAK